ncbi:hypothetical protein [Nocardia camponoti]|uniref:hypothetical protein n=1 Tax=Nocardia camponoti TaxID=1616106 RepID=UPI00166C921B|nr:hypothetical protein [Nocardia camponoti]
MANEAARIANPEATQGFTHTQINKAFNPLQPNDNALAAANQYSLIAQKWRHGVATFAARMRRASSAAWEGAAAEKSRQAVGNYATRADELTPALDALANRVHETVSAITLTQHNLPDVIKEFSWTSASTWFGRLDDERDENEERARQVMANNYVAPFGNADKVIPVLPAPVSPTNPLYSSVDAGGGGSDSGAGSKDQSAKPGDTPSDPGTQQTPDETSNVLSNNKTGDESGEDDDTTSDDDKTSPSSTNPETPSTAPSGTTPSTPNGLPNGLSPGGGSPGGGSPGGASPGGGSPAPGTSQVGPRAPGAATVNRTVGAGNSTTGRAGMPGMGMPGAGRGRGDDDESTHKIPDYLITAENTEELLGPMPRVIAGVIGAQDPIEEQS